MQGENIIINLALRRIQSGCETLACLEQVLLSRIIVQYGQPMTVFELLYPCSLYIPFAETLSEIFEDQIVFYVCDGYPILSNVNSLTFDTNCFDICCRLFYGYILSAYTKNQELRQKIYEENGNEAYNFRV